MNALQAVGLFLGLPILFGVIVYLLVSGPSWIRAARSEDVLEGGPLLVSSARPMPDPSRLPSEMAASNSTDGGGVSARW